jgi:hypothetical protein
MRGLVACFSDPRHRREQRGMPTRFELATFGLKGRRALALGPDLPRRCDRNETRVLGRTVFGR